MRARELGSQCKTLNCCHVIHDDGVGFSEIALIKLLTNDKFNIKAFTTNQYPLSLIYRSTIIM